LQQEQHSPSIGNWLSAFIRVYLPSSAVKKRQESQNNP
jgi:hypothetical protein